MEETSNALNLKDIRIVTTDTVLEYQVTDMIENFDLDDS